MKALKNAELFVTKHKSYLLAIIHLHLFLAHIDGLCVHMIRNLGTELLAKVAWLSMGTHLFSVHSGNSF